MVISENTEASNYEFEALLTRTKSLLNTLSKNNVAYFSTRTPKEFEHDVYDNLVNAAKNSPFEGTIKLISGLKFPDISVSEFYGVEVKATTAAKWKSTGNSVLENTRLGNISRIYIFFGQLCVPSAFKWRLYQDCLYDVAVTHSPRYLIDMELSLGKSIFSKIGIEYDKLRCLEDPIAPIVDYYRKKAKNGEEPWWMGTHEETLPLTVKLWGDLKPSEKRIFETQAMARFPEIFSKSSNIKYKNLAGWLAARHGIVSTSLRDSFSAGGKRDIAVGPKIYNNLPQVFDKLKNMITTVITEVNTLSNSEMIQYWKVDENEICASSNIKLWFSKLRQYAGPQLGEQISFIDDLILPHLRNDTDSGDNHRCLNV